MTALVTGATGFVGRHLTERLVSTGSVRALSRPSADVAELEGLGVEIVRGDVRDPAAAARAVEGCDVVYHLAGRTTTERLDERTYAAVNAVGTRNLGAAAAAAGAKRFVLCSSVGVYGAAVSNCSIDEDTPPRPSTPYGRSKLAAEHAARAFEQDGLQVVVARLASAFGPRGRSWLPLFRSVEGGEARIIGRGRNHQHPVDIADAVEGLLRCGSMPGVEGRTYVLAGPEALTLAELLGVIADEVGGPPPQHSSLPAAALRLYRLVGRAVTPLGLTQLPRFDRVEFFLADRVFQTEVARRELGYEPRVDVRAMIARTAAWFRDRGLLHGRHGEEL